MEIFIDKEENISIVSKPDIKERAKIDDTDKKILVALAQHGTLSSIQIGQELGITSVAVRNRIKKLLKNYQSPQIIAVACDAELKEGISFAKKNNLNIKSIKLLRDGCVNTDADFDKLYSMI